jgi:mannose-6-phosphate isomerase-like protein (cupin superfamily)
MQRHDQTDEVFVLLEGRCILFLGAGGDSVTELFAEDMQPLKLYNVKRGTWHSHTLSDDAVVLIVENIDTTVWN